VTGDRWEANIEYKLAHLAELSITIKVLLGIKYHETLSRKFRIQSQTILTYEQKVIEPALLVESTT